MSISVLCASCRILVDAPGVAYTDASVFEAAWALGWTVKGRRCYCPTCRPTDGKVQCSACKGAGKIRVVLTEAQAAALDVVATTGVVAPCEPCGGSGRVLKEGS